MLRAFIRFSIDGDNGTLTTRMRTILEDAGFVRIGTSAYEHTGIPPALLTATMNTFWAAVGNPAGAAQNVPAAARFDHVWIYMGQVGGGDLVG